MQIHPTAFIEDGAQLGKDVIIGPYCTVGANVILGDHCHLRSHVVIEGHTTIGEHNTFFPFSVIGVVPQDLKYKQEDTTLHIGSHNTFRESVSVHLGTVTGIGDTVIGDHNLFMGYVHIAHDCIVGNHNIFANYAALCGHVIIEDHMTLGGQCGVMQFMKIGSYCYIGAGTMVDRNLPTYTTGYGARIQVKGVNIIGLERKGFSREQIKRILGAHRLLFRSSMKAKEAVQAIEEKYGDYEEVQKMVEFIKGVDYKVKTTSGAE